MALASFPLIIRRWRRSSLYHVEYSKYSQLQEYLTEEDFLSRMNTINKHIYNEYPHTWIDTYLFIIAVILVIVAAAFSVVARAITLSMWYPLIILIIPAIIAFITTKRRNAYYDRLSDYYSSLQSCLKEMNSIDVTRQIKWNFRRLKEVDTAVAMNLQPPLSKYRINFVIDIIQINVENELLAEEGEALPAYDLAIIRDTVLDIGPEVEQVPGNRSNYITAPSSAALVMLSDPSSTSPLRLQPPAYHEHRSIRTDDNVELASIYYPPPAYISNEEIINAPPNTVTSSMTTVNNR
ncbi:uncharacterized protein BX663DRAFT_498424 [Cokeromyces recurvatus]|uniref:uncharacterized protein n=1 Tax=Cokeromyces recurvatus TaxID=90255 RepID=UPI00221F42A5|nr:uncharacterized protein BX663DRAFT_498424 [Cokeromyces recurvatus]KAI7905993.1 hypothetical protein BX663DRAFT_498424 [Cokeromyces recurvatus]